MASSKYFRKLLTSSEIFRPTSKTRFSSVEGFYLEVSTTGGNKLKDMNWQLKKSTGGCRIKILCSTWKNEVTVLWVRTGRWTQLNHVKPQQRSSQLVSMPVRAFWASLVHQSRQVTYFYFQCVALSGAQTMLPSWICCTSCLSGVSRTNSLTISSTHVETDECTQKYRTFWDI